MELQSMSARLATAKAEWEAEKLNLVNEATKLRQAVAQATAQANAPERTMSNSKSGCRKPFECAMVLQPIWKRHGRNSPG